MTKDQVKQIINSYIWDLPLSAEPESGPIDKTWKEWGDKDIDNHIFYMCGKISQFLKEDNIEKAMRWLGFVQCLEFVYRQKSIAKLAEGNR